MGKVVIVLKGSKTSGWYSPPKGTHSGKKHRAAGSGKAAKPLARSQEEIVSEALGFVSTLTLSGGSVDIRDLSPEAKVFLAQTVEKSSYKLYRGMGLIKTRVDPAHVAEINKLSSGDAVPESLMKQHNVFASYTVKRGVAKYYSEGRVSIIMRATVSKNDVVVDTRNLHKVLSGISQKKFDESDFDYFRSEGEVIVQEPVNAEIYSISGKL